MHLIKVVKYLSGAIFEMTGAHGINIYQNNGAAAGQEVPHVHFHIIPRRQDDNAMSPWNRSKIDPEQLKQIAEEMGKNLKPISSSTVKLSSNTSVSKKTSKPKRKGKPVKVKRRNSTNSP